ncbi:rhamnan synthesis F family protein [Erwinia tasmaniensis]|uniref:rhamnan synthesis F family protein n=1 Tax=Erwinia tasmaniensis TaxID=338565 RepID=UPI003A4D57B3
MKRIVRYFYKLFIKVILFSYYSLLSYRDSIKTKRFTNIIQDKEFVGGKVMLLALYEKTALRNDTIELLKEAKRQNVFIIGVNTLKLSNENYPEELIDVYIERDNFGRDFGSYQAGMQYIYRKKVDERCSRLLIINDSVFFSKKGLPEFIKDLFETKTEVLGATENKEISHHLGSFCISVLGRIVSHEKFENYWKNYKLTNVRPLVIKRGEFTLSTILKSLVSSENNFKAIYDVAFFESALARDKELFHNYYYFRREGSRRFWTNTNLIDYFKHDFILKSFYDKYIEGIKLNSEVLKNSRYETKPSEEDQKVDFVNFATFMSTVDFETLPHGKLLKQRLMSIYLDDFTRGSQIHNNCISLHRLGLPIIKLDLLYRTVCNFNDLIKIKEQLDESQQEDFMTLMTNRLSGEKFLFGLNRQAFECGIM